MSNIPTTTQDVKTAALLALLQKFEEIDANDGSRNAFGVNIVMSQHYGGNKAIFDNEINLIRTTLGLAPKEVVCPALPETELMEPDYSKLSFEL